MMGPYRSICKLQEDAENQLNIAGREFHVYVYSLDGDLKPTEQDHVHYPAER